MKKILFLSLSFLAVACTTPTTQDFQSETRPLGEDEFVTIWRFPRSATMYEVQDTSSRHAQAMESHMAPIFQQLIPRIFADARTDKLSINESKNENEIEDQPIVDLPAAMADHHNANWQNLDPFMGVFHIIQRRNATTKGFLADEVELELVSQDPNKVMPERYFGSVRMRQLVDLEYEIEAEGTVFPLRDYLSKLVPFMYPIHYRTVDFANGLVSLDQAFQTKAMVLDGRWNEIEWLGAAPNLTEHTFVAQPAETLTALVGTYDFLPSTTGFMSEKDFSTDYTGDPQAEITIEGDNLVVNFPHKAPWFGKELFPTSTTFFFNGNGEEATFEQSETEVRFILNQGTDSEVIAVKKR